MEVAYQRFGLTLMVNHACNLRCAYCYTGAKFSSPMAWELGVAGIDRAFGSLKPNGHLDLGFFGGEPLLESRRILEWMAYARQTSANTGKKIRFNLTTNGTLTSATAWHVMMAEDLELTVSFDGHPRLHDRHRRDVEGRGSAAQVEAAIGKLVDAQRTFRVNFVVRPDTVDDVPAGLVYLHELGVRQVDASLDLWTPWNAQDGRRLEAVIERAAELWRQWLPEFSMNWFDTKLGDLAGLPYGNDFQRCGFGDGEIAVAPSGRLYPCERLIGEDRPDQPHRLAGHVLDGTASLGQRPTPFIRCQACAHCALARACDTGCRCSNFVRTGDVNRPDGLLCLFNKATARATSRVLAEVAVPGQPLPSTERTIAYVE